MKRITILKVGSLAGDNEVLTVIIKHQMRELTLKETDKRQAEIVGKIHEAISEFYYPHFIEVK